MTISVQEFTNKYDGKAVDFDGYYGAQCVDLANFYAREVVESKPFATPATGGAIDIWTVPGVADPSFYRRVTAGQPLRVGDVLIYGEPYGRHIENGVQKFWGHVAIYIGNDRVLEQNGRQSQMTTISSVDTRFIAGILRPLKFEPQTPAQDVAPPTTNTNTLKINQGDTFWGLEDRNNWPHGTLQQLNPGIDPKTLQIGSTIIIPHAISIDEDDLRNENLQPALDRIEYYTIIAGDTFWGLENAWQLAHGTLKQLNPGIDPHALQIGQRIRKR